MPEEFSTGDLTVLRQAPVKSWSHLLSGKYPGRVPPLSRKVDKEIRQGVVGSLAAPRPDWRAAHDWLYLGVLLTEGALLGDYMTIRELTPTKLGRPNFGPAAKMLDTLRSSCRPLGLSEVQSRLTSIIELFNLRRAMIPHDYRFERAIEDLPRTALRVLVAETDSRFFGLDADDEAGAPSIPPEERISREEYATGVSFILTTYNRLRGISEENFFHAGVRFSVQELDALIRQALHQFKVAEVEVDVLRAGAVCRRVAETRWAVEWPHDGIGRSIELGYIVSQLQGSIAAMRVREVDPSQARFSTFADACFDRFGDQMFRWADRPFKRLTIAINPGQAREFGEKILRDDRLFVEEFDFIERACKELVVDLSDVRNADMAEGLKLWDVLLFARLFLLLAMNRRRVFLRHPAGHRDEIQNSAVFMMTAAQFVEFLGAFGYSKESSERFLSLFEWNVSERNSYADLQYRSIIRVGDRLYVPIGILAGSDPLRSILVTQSKRFSSGTQRDRVSERLLEALSAAGVSVARSEVKFRFRSESSDIDVVAVMGGTLFVFECKNTLHPCSSFEMRATYDQVDKGAMQLSRLERLWNDAEFRRKLASTIGYHGPSVTRLKTCIVLSHRVLMGSSHRGHPVRHLYELLHLIEDGTAEFGTAARTVSVPMRAPGPLSEEHLLDYLSDRFPWHAACWKSMATREEVLEFGRASLAVKRHSLSFVDLMREMGVSEGFIAHAAAVARS